MVQHGEMTRRAIAKLAYHHIRFKRTKTETENAFEATTKKLLELSAGKACTHIQNMCAKIVEEFLPDALNPKIVAEIDRHKQDGRDTWLVTASPKEIAEVISLKLGMTGGFGTEGEVVDEKYSGRLIKKPLHGFSKAEKIQELSEEYKYDLENSFAYSDSINDLPLLTIVGNPNIVNPNKELETVARKNSWPVLATA